jgi:rhamnosyltransferase
MTSIIAIIVTFNPEKSKLKALIDALVGQVDQIVIVDNGSLNRLCWIESEFVNNKVKVIYLNSNKGIAEAQNVGIQFAHTNNAMYVAIFDHDSNPALNMLSLLKEAILKMESKGAKVAAVGPRYLDARQNNPPPFIQIRGIRVVKKSCNDDNAIVPVSYLISSGSLIPLATLKEVGMMKVELFVDYVDIEWGLRASKLGFESFGVCNAYMEHELGDDPINFFGKNIPLHSPLRHYYHFRNAVWLYRQSYLPILWKVADAWRLLLKYGFYTLFAKPRLQHFLMMTKGIWHGLIGKVGKLQD